MICAACHKRGEPGVRFLAIAIVGTTTKTRTTVCSTRCADDLSELLVPGGLDKALAEQAAKHIGAPAP